MRTRNICTNWTENSARARIEVLIVNAGRRAADSSGSKLNWTSSAWGSSANPSRIGFLADRDNANPPSLWRASLLSKGEREVMRASGLARPLSIVRWSQIDSPGLAPSAPSLLSRLHGQGDAGIGRAPRPLLHAQNMKSITDNRSSFSLSPFYPP
jgi:hypothetical protein